MVRKRSQEFAVVPSLPDELWDDKKVMELLKIKRTKLGDLMRKEGLPYIKIAQALRFDPRDVALWLEQQKSHSA